MAASIKCGERPFRGGSEGALPPQPKFGGSGRQRPPAKIRGEMDCFRKILKKKTSKINFTSNFLDFYKLRMLGSPNPGQSFGRGLCGPEATEVKKAARQVGRQNVKKNFKNRIGIWKIAASGTQAIWVRAAAVSCLF